MGRSSSSCFKIITCGSDSTVKDDDLEASEVKSDKRGWSFRKRSARHRVLSNTVVSETQTPTGKECTEPSDLKLQQPVEPDVPEKVAAVQFKDEKLQLSTLLETNETDPVVVATSEAPAEIKSEAMAECKVEVPVDLKEDVAPAGFELGDSDAILIQSTIRAFMAQRTLLKVKNVIKLQAAVRGHLVRNHAKATLRCVQAIVKMQALVRAHRTKQLTEGSSADSHVDEKDGKGNIKATEKPTNKANVSYVSIQKLLSNRFARQLLESTPKTKPMNVKCEISENNSAWKWLERWMYVSSAEPSPDTDSKAEQQKLEENANLVSEVETEVTSGIPHGSEDPSFTQAEVEVGISTQAEGEVGISTKAADNLEIQEHEQTPPEGENTEYPQLDTASNSTVEEPSEISSTPAPAIYSDDNSQVDHASPVDPKEENEPPKHSRKRSASGELEAEGKKSSGGSRKATNPTYIAAQSKFEELSSNTQSYGSVNNSSQNVNLKTEVDTASSREETVGKMDESNMSKNSAPNISVVQIGGSECGTEPELSISSTLDSPDRYDDGTIKLENLARVSEDVAHNSDSNKGHELESGDSAAIPLPVASDPTPEQQIKTEDVISEPVNSNAAVESHLEEQKTENASDLPGENSQSVQQAYRSSPEASPRSHMTVPESQGTPGSQVSVKTKGSKTDKTASSNKRKSLSMSKKSPSSAHSDSGSSTKKQLPKDQKNARRRNSFGSLKQDNVEQESRDSSASSTIPHFMQATESAKAKVNANNSPRSSPDVLDRDYAKKRHSLPGENGRQGSPRVHRPTLQAQGAKANGAVPKERKWQR